MHRIKTEILKWASAIAFVFIVAIFLKALWIVFSFGWNLF